MTKNNLFYFLVDRDENLKIKLSVQAIATVLFVQFLIDFRDTVSNAKVYGFQSSSLPTHVSRTVYEWERILRFMGIPACLLYILPHKVKTEV